MTTPENTSPAATDPKAGEQDPAASVVVKLDGEVNPDDAAGKPPVEPSKDDAVDYGYEPTGDTGLDMALEFVAKQGLKADHPAMVAAQTGDFSILRATLAAKSAPGWEQFVALGEDAYKRNAAAASAKNEAVKKVVVEVAGSAEDWASVQKWASENATPDEKAEINGMLDKGGIQAKLAAQYLVDKYAKAGNVIQEPQNAASGAARNGPGDTSKGGPLSPQEYKTELQALNAKLRGRLDGNPEYTALQARRLAYKG